MQATLHNCSDVKLNDATRLKVSKVDIPEQKVDFSRLQ
jgi:exoribonuclease-2